VAGLRDEIPPGSVVATACAGIPAYFSDFRMVDELGYSDRHIARLPPAFPLGPDNYQLFQPGHVKWDEAYVLARRPAAIVRCVAGGRFGDGRTAAGGRVPLRPERPGAARTRAAWRSAAGPAAMTSFLGPPSY